MRPLAILLFALEASIWTQAYPKGSDKELVVLEIEPTSADKSKTRLVRQNPEAPQQYYLRQYNPPQQQPGAPPRLPQLVGNSQPRYVLSPDGRFLQEAGPVQEQQLQLNRQFPRDRHVVPVGPVPQPTLDEFAEAQMRLQQDYHDAPLRAQIAGLTNARPHVTARPEIQAGPESASPQVFGPAPTDPRSGLVPQHAQPVDPASLQLVPQQQFYRQPSFASVDTGRQIGLFTQAPRGQVYYQPNPQSQPQQQEVYTPRLPAPPTRKPVEESASGQLAPSSKAQLLQTPQEQPSYEAFAQQQQYILQQASRQAPQPSQPQFHFLQQQQDLQPDLSALFAPPTRGLFSPSDKPSTPSFRSSIYLTRPRAQAQAPAPAPTQEALPTVRIPAPVNQRPISQAEFDALVQAGYNITPVRAEEPQPSLFKSKRAHFPVSRNHVTYTNEQDGVTYQYSPGSSEYNPTHKSKRFAPRQPLDYDSSDSHVMYVIAVRKPAA